MASAQTRLWQWIAISVTLAGFGFWQIHVLDQGMAMSHSDLVPVQIGVRAALHGQDPYSAAVTKQSQIAYYGRELQPSDHLNQMGFAYPAFTALVLAPLAFLSWPTAREIFLWLAAIGTAFSAPLWISFLGLQWRNHRIAVVTALVMVSWPVLWGLRLQQVTLLVAAATAASCYLLRRGNSAPAGILLAVATIKPQLVGPLAAWLLIWAAGRRAWLFAGSFSVTLIALLLGAEWIAPGWLPRWRAAGSALLIYTDQHPALFFIGGKWVGGCLELVLGVFCVVIAWRSIRCSLSSVQFAGTVSMILAATITLLPTDAPMIYNQVFLIPAILLVWQLAPRSAITSAAQSIATKLVLWGFVSVVIADIGGAIFRADLWQEVAFSNILLPIFLCITLGLELMRQNSSGRGELVS